MYFCGKEKRDSGNWWKTCGMRDSREKGAGTRDQDPPSRPSYQSLPGGGEFDPRVTGVGNLNCIHDFMWNLWRGELSWGTRCWGFSWKRLCLCGQLVTRKGLKQTLCRIWRYLNFNIVNIGFWLLIWIIPITSDSIQLQKAQRSIILWPAASQ